MRRKAGVLPKDASKVTKAIRPKVDDVFHTAMSRWLQTFATNVPVWRGTTRASLLFASGNIPKAFASYLGVSVPIVETPPNQGTVRQWAISKANGLVRVNKPHGNVTNPDKFVYEFSYTTSTPGLLMSRNWPLGARDSVQAESPQSAANMAASAFQSVMTARVIKTIFIDELRRQGFEVS